MKFLLFITLLFSFLFNTHSQVVINELGISPSTYDGSIVGPGPGGAGEGEWIELYNTDLCNSVDISNYIIGNYNSNDGYGAAYVFPSSLVISAGGFAIVRGSNAPNPPFGVTDVIVANTSGRYCLTGPGTGRMWFPNAGSWVALYNKKGIPIDMAKWGSPIQSDLDNRPCIPSVNAGGFSMLTAFNSFAGAKTISSSPSTSGKTFVRIPDGGPWSTIQDNENTSLGSRNRPINAVISYAGSPWCITSSNKSVTLTGTGFYTGGTYSSTNGLSINPSTGQITVSSSSAGTYIVSYAVSNFSCSGIIATTTVQITAASTPTFTQIAPICSGGTFTLPTTSTNSFTGSWSPATNTSSTTTYTFTPTSGLCATTTTMTVSVGPPTTPTFTQIAPICSGGTFTLPTTSTNSFTGSWSPAINTSASTTYTFTPGLGQCASNTSMTVSVNPILALSISCGISSKSSVNFNWNALAGVTSYDITYTINGGTSQNGGNQTTTSFSVTGLNIDEKVNVSVTAKGSGCYKAGVKTCFSDNCTRSVAAFVPTPETITSQNPETTFINNSTNSIGYLWDFGDGSSTSNETNPTHKYTIEKTGSFLVILIALNIDGCNDTLTRTVIVKEELIYYVPNAFTPDGDQFNNEFKPIFYSGYDPYSYTMRIFNRWGELVFETNNVEIGWKGTFGEGGNVVQDGLYIWKMEFKQNGIDKKIMEIGSILIAK